MVYHLIDISFSIRVGIGLNLNLLYTLKIMIIKHISFYWLGCCHFKEETFRIFNGLIHWIDNYSMLLNPSYGWIWAIFDVYTFTVCGLGWGHLISTISTATHSTVLLISQRLVGAIGTRVTAISCCIGSVTSTATDYKEDREWKMKNKKGSINTLNH